MNHIRNFCHIDTCWLQMVLHGQCQLTVVWQFHCWLIPAFQLWCSEMRKVLFLVPSLCLYMKYLWNCRMDLRQIHTEDVFGS